jgi:hypothetical protein
LWTYRKKQGLGRASKNEFVNVLEVGPRFFAMVDFLRKWHLGFPDYYDVYIWDFVPCQPSVNLYNVMINVSLCPPYLVLSLFNQIIIGAEECMAHYLPARHIQTYGATLANPDQGGKLNENSEIEARRGCCVFMGQVDG